jgi:hypothetical protein
VTVGGEVGTYIGSRKKALSLFRMYFAKKYRIPANNLPANLQTCWNVFASILLVLNNLKLNYDRMQKQEIPVPFKHKSFAGHHYCIHSF